MRIKAEDTLCLVVDIQERLTPSIKDMETIEKNSIILLKGLEVLNIPIIVTRQYPKGLGDTILSIKEVTKDKLVLDKIEFSCFANEEIKKEVLSQNKKNIILIGIETHICMMQTVIDIKEEGLNPIIVGDCIGSRKKSDKKIAFKRFQHEGCIITTYESILFELLEKSGSDTFKQISQLIK